MAFDVVRYSKELGKILDQRFGEVRAEQKAADARLLALIQQLQQRVESIGAEVASDPEVKAIRNEAAARFGR